mgnify:CR=1
MAVPELRCAGPTSLGANAQPVEMKAVQLERHGADAKRVNQKIYLRY